MDGQIGIPPDRGSEVGVILEHQPVMPDRAGVVLRLHHRPEDLPVEHRPIGLILRRQQNLPELAGRHLGRDPFRVLPDRQQDLPEGLQLLAVRLFMHPVDKGEPQRPADRGGRFVGEQHKFLNHPLGLPPLTDGDPLAAAVIADQQLTFGAVDLRHPTARPDSLPEGVKPVENRQERADIPVFFQEGGVLFPTQQPVDLTVHPFDPGADDRLDKPEGAEFAAPVQLHQRRKGEPVLAGV